MLCKKNNALIGALTMTLGAFVVKVLGFLYKIPLSRFLGDEGMGYYNSAMTVYTSVLGRFRERISSNSSLRQAAVWK